MKRLVALLMAVLMVSVGSAVAQKYSIRGRVVDSSAGIYEKDSAKPKKKKNTSKKKSCNADRVVKDDKKFRKFAKAFMREQKKAGEQICQNT